jgi:hypothetical protein
MFDLGGPSSGLKESLVFGNNTFLADEHEAAKLRWAGDAQRPFGVAMRPKTGARSERARTRGKNPLVQYNRQGVYRLTLSIICCRLLDKCSLVGMSL